MSDIKELPRGFIAEFVDYGDGTNNAYLSKKVNGREYTGSLAFVGDFMEIEDGFAALNVPQSIYDLAYTWAVSKGY